MVILSDGCAAPPVRRRSVRGSGRVITMNDLPFTIVGVMPASFEPLISERFYQRAEHVGAGRLRPVARRTPAATASI